MGREQKRKNIVLLMTDQLRGDCMGCAGHPDVKTPYLDTLASKGVRFENAYSACPSCVPARAALHTGLTQESHRRVGYADGIRWEYPHTMAGELTKAGYYTQCVGKMHVDPLRNYLGFCHVELHDGYLHYYRDPEIPYRENQKQADDYFHWLKQEKGIDCDVTDTGLECNSWVARPWIYEEKYHPTNWVTDRSIDFLRRRDPDMPFFLFTSYLRPHPPFDAPQCYFDMYRNKELTPPVVGDWCDEEALRARGRIFDSDTGPLDPELVREMQIGYYACITHLDHQIGRLIQALVENKLYDDTIILFVSDHGELLGDHHLFRKSRAYQGSSRVPFLVSGGGFRPEKPGSVKTDVVELRDVMPTVLEAAGVQIPDSVEGISLWNTALKESGTPEVREYLHGEHTLGEASSHWIITRDEKYIWYSQTGEEQYFWIAEDPEELHNLIGSETAKERVEALRGLLIQELQDREEGFVREGRLVTGCEPIVWLTKGK
ncbi:arylsulfatase [Eisenbergiella massiliensis]|uniref:Arylsulfatase n=1 Tax=Eisenbergiella massiliensis TaxID=1720294 RepID=A0A3E3I1B7_9FIRM|nr:arylsulfatase [Eisenbergiella massiliensis]RGE58273.1 arylsulfatase [Eisenbergiella massiliensis]